MGLYIFLTPRLSFDQRIEVDLRYFELLVEFLQQKQILSDITFKLWEGPNSKTLGGTFVKSYPTLVTSQVKTDLESMKKSTAADKIAYSLEMRGKATLFNGAQIVEVAVIASNFYQSLYGNVFLEVMSELRSLNEKEHLAWMLDIIEEFGKRIVDHENFEKMVWAKSPEATIDVSEAEFLAYKQPSTFYSDLYNLLGKHLIGKAVALGHSSEVEQPLLDIKDRLAIYDQKFFIGAIEDSFSFRDHMVAYFNKEQVITSTAHSLIVRNSSPTLGKFKEVVDNLIIALSDSIKKLENSQQVRKKIITTLNNTSMGKHLSNLDPFV